MFELTFRTENQRTFKLHIWNCTFVWSLQTYYRYALQEHIQNCTLAGGVAAGSCCHMVLFPWAAGLIGCFAAVISVVGSEYLTVSTSLSAMCQLYVCIKLCCICIIMSVAVYVMLYIQCTYVTLLRVIRKDFPDPLLIHLWLYGKVIFIYTIVSWWLLT